MKKILIILIIAVFLVSLKFDMDSFAESYGEKVQEKLNRGMDNISTFYFEGPNTMSYEKKKHNIFVASTWGFVKGAIRGAARLFIGMYELVTVYVPHGPIMGKVET